jgi:hypothetical protein
VAIGRETPHVGSNLGDDSSNESSANAWDGIAAVDRTIKGRKRSSIWPLMRRPNAFRHRWYAKPMMYSSG